jgi:hypothetical protein
MLVRSPKDVFSFLVYKANRDFVRENSGWHLLDKLKFSSMQLMTDITYKAIKSQARLGGIPGLNAESRAMGLVQAGLSWMTSSFVKMAM